MFVLGVYSSKLRRGPVTISSNAYFAIRASPLRGRSTSAGMDFLAVWLQETEMIIRTPTAPKI